MISSPYRSPGALQTVGICCAQAHLGTGANSPGHLLVADGGWWLVVVEWVVNNEVSL